MTRLVALAALTGALSFTACDSFGQAMTSHTDVLARAAGQELTVDQVVQLLGPATRIPAQNDVIDAVANLWVDYTLLATAAAQDSTLQNVNLDAVVVPFFNQQLVFQLRDKVIQVDTVLTDEQLRAEFEKEQPGAEMRARHILFRIPPDASPTVRDSVTQRMQQVLQQARSGADFAQLAAQYSEEPGAAERGGDLGFFGPGQMMQPFEEAARALAPGEIGTAETPYGLHIIKLEEKRLPDFAAVKDEFRGAVVQRRWEEAEEAYLTQLTSSRALEVQEGAIDIARELARKPGASLSRRASQRMMVRYAKGGLTAGEFMLLMQQRNAQQRSQIAAASDDQLREWLRLVARDEILIEQAKAEGLEAPQTSQDSARRELRTELQQAARDAGLLPITPAPGENQAQAIQRQVMEFIGGIISGERNVLPLNALSFSLRQQFDADIYERAIPTAVARLQELRPPQPQMPQVPGMEQPQMPQPQMPPPQQQQAPPPTTGN